MSSDCEVRYTAEVAAAWGCRMIKVYYFPDKAEDPSVWVRLSSPGSDSFTCLTVTQAQELRAGLHEAIAAMLPPTIPEELQSCLKL